MLESLKDMLTRNNKENEVFLIKTSQIIKGRIHKVVNSTLEDFKFNVDFRFGEAEIVINEGYRVKVIGIQPTCLFFCIGEKIKAFLDGLAKNSCVQRSILGKVTIYNYNLNGRIEIRGKKIKVLVDNLQLQIKLPIDFEVNFDNVRTNIIAILDALKKLDFYISLVV